MKRAYFIPAILFAWCIMSLSCHEQGKNKPSSDFVTENINAAADQYRLLAAQTTRSGQLLNPKSFIDGKVKYISKDEWTSGFFPGSLWYLYDLTGDDQWKELAGPPYHAKTGGNGNFILMHSVGSIPHHSEVDVPLNYADYYFLEALKRKRDLEM